MSGFSMELLNNETVREWLMCRSEPTLPCTIVETAFPMRAYLQFDSFSVTSDYLVKPLGVVNGILLGYVLGDPYSFALSQNWGPMVHPASRRFAFNLETQEFLEFHWYLHNNTLLANWMKFPTKKHRLRYFVLYEAPPPGKIPYKLLSSVELVLQRTESGKHQVLSASDDLFTLLPPVEQSLQNIPTALEFATLLLGTFSGTFRWIQYDPETLTITEDELYAYSVTVCSRTHAEDLRLRELRRLCYPSLQVENPTSELYDKKQSELVEDSFDPFVSQSSCEDRRISSSLSDNSRIITPSVCSFTSTEQNSAGNESIFPSNSEVCLSRGDGAFVQNTNSGLLWTYSWNFAPQEYFDSYSSDASSTDNIKLERELVYESVQNRNECEHFIVRDFFNDVDYCSNSRNLEFSSNSSVASDYYMTRKLSDINLSEYWSSEDDILTSVDLPAFSSVWDLQPQDSADNNLQRNTENDVATLFLNDGDWHFWFGRITQS
eukprot:jgi/Galph1/2925/GphlegSOOS_G1580.1